MLISLPTMIAVPPGTIVLRDARTKTSRTVELQSFHIARTPVTSAQYASVLGIRVPEGQDVDTPVHSVSWLDAIEWCNALSARAERYAAYALEGDDVTWDVSADGFRLPTEAEWEWACRAETTGPRYGILSDIAWTEADRLTGPQPVGSKQANAFGVSDMLGNVWEWCWDYSDPARYADYRVLRGGGWADKHWSVRASVRRGSMPHADLDDIGFRVAQGSIDGASEAAQGWSHHADRDRAQLAAAPFGWTPLQL